MSKFLSLYVDACRSVMRLDLRNVESWTELNKYLPAVRHALMCCVCGRLLDTPMGLDPSICHHYVCRSCLGGKMRYMKGGCGWCKNFDEFVPIAHLSAVVRCFKQLCVYLNGFITAGMKNNPEVETIATIVRDAIGDDFTDCPSQVVNDVIVLESKDTVRCEVPTTSENISVLSKLTEETSHSRKRRHVEGTSEPSWKRAKRAHHGFGRKSKAKDSGTASSQHQEEYLTSFENNEATSQLISWSSNNMHSGAHDDDNRSVDDETSFLNSSYDTDLLLLENSVLAEHDYNKYTTVSDEAVSSTAVELVSVTRSTKSPKGQANAVRRSYSKKLSLDHTTPVRKSSLTIRQISERDQLGSPVSTSKVTVVTNNNDATGLKPPSQRRPKSGAIKIKIGCRCAMATPAPGKLTCCGQRCPCYAAFHGCSTSCKCRGCRNPRGDPVHTMPVFNSSIALKTSTTTDLQSSLPLIFDASSATFSTAARDQQQSQQLVLHATKSRFLTETFSCFGSG